MVTTGLSGASCTTVACNRTVISMLLRYPSHVTHCGNRGEKCARIVRNEFQQSSGFPRQQPRLADLNLPVRRTGRNRAGKGTFTISRELVADRLRCMLRHIQSRDTHQVVLQTMAITAALMPLAAHAESIRDLVQEAQGLFARGALRAAEQRLHEALKIC